MSWRIYRNNFFRNNIQPYGTNRFNHFNGYPEHCKVSVVCWTGLVCSVNTTKFPFAGILDHFDCIEVDKCNSNRSCLSWCDEWGNTFVDTVICGRNGRSEVKFSPQHESFGIFRTEFGKWVCDFWSTTPEFHCKEKKSKKWRVELKMHWVTGVLLIQKQILLTVC